MKFFFTHSHGLRRIGSAATDLAYVACGRYDSFYEYSLKPWDVAAGAFIVKTAGGRVGNFSGGNDYVFTGEIIASNQHVFEEMTSVVGSFMNSNQ
jgi:myo-inositol-1(or 4)-monophosphatase